ncbi:phage late control D family protein [Morganella morganii]|uniref:phage late control D family protein n=1 Tax=Morganella morganii TaxID=582 RepID=UPI0027124C8F|nr:phage late control D family protein [Morganella morganii]EMD0831774.1 phage late control D family protein [Morganella morganii]MDO7862008.1 phage late control D family protein [Morganella morganii]
MFEQYFDPELVKQPAFDITIGGKQVLSLNGRMMGLTLTDNRGFEADTLEITIDDTDGKIELPPRGVEVSVAIGWRGEPLTHKGIFTVDEVSHSGPPDQLIVTARSADFRQDFNVKREYSWHDITVGKVVSAIAGRYNLTPAVSRQLIDIEIDHADQTNESDISFLSRMAEMLGAIATIKNGNLLFIIPNRGLSASGKSIPEIVITRDSGDKHSFRVADRDAYTGVKANWLDLNFGKKPETSVKRKKRKSKKPKKEKKEKSSSKEGEYLEGAEGNVFVMRQTFKTETAAKRAAAAKWLKLQRGAAEFSITLARGRADLFPEMPATVSGFKSVIDNHKWIIARVVHQIGEGGFQTQLELELKIDNDNMVDGDNSDN